MVYGTAVLAVLGGIIFYSGFDWGNWPTMLILTVLLIYLQTCSVRLGERTDYSLSTATVFPIIYLCGTTPAMLIALFSGLVDGLTRKKDWQRTLFNMSQLSLCSLLASLSLKYLSILLGIDGLGGVLAMGGATLVYVLSNIAFVSLIVSIWRGVSWWNQLKLLSMRSLHSSFSSGFTGLIFTYFAKSYGFWGLLGFSALMVNLSGLLQSAAKVSSERARREELEEALVIDEMTTAFNFRYLNKWLSAAAEDQMALLFMDIDDFSIFNNTYGHAEGDEVLRVLVETINKSVRTDDKVIRYGGDEFVVLLNGMDGEGAMRVAQRIMGNLGSVRRANWKEPITVSMGIASAPRDARDKHQLLLFADQAMYAAKGAGKNTIQMWNAEKDPA